MLSEIKLPSTFYFYPFSYSLGIGGKRQLIQSQLYVHCIDFSLVCFLDVLPEGLSSSHVLQNRFKRLYFQKAVYRLKAIPVRPTFLSHSVCMRPNFQGLPCFECDGLVKINY